MKTDFTSPANKAVLHFHAGSWLPNNMKATRKLLLAGSPTKSTMPKPVPIEVVAARHDDHAAIIVERTGSIIWPGVGAAPIIRSA